MCEFFLFFVFLDLSFLLAPALFVWLRDFHTAPLILLRETGIWSSDITVCFCLALKSSHQKNESHLPLFSFLHLLNITTLPF